MIRSGMDNASGTAGNITVKANSVLLTTGATSEQPSQISTVLNNQSTGTSGNITIDTQILSILNGSYVVTGANNSQATGGKITVNATDIHIADVLPQAQGNFADNSAIMTQLSDDSRGQGGDIQITTQQLRLERGGRVTSAVYNSRGRAGDVWVKANTIEVSGGYAATFTPSSIGSILTGNNPVQSAEVSASGNVLVEADRIRLFAGGIFQTGVYGAYGRPGDLTVRARTIEADGVADYVQESGFFANSLNNGWQGKSGVLTIEADTLRLSDGAKVVSRSIGFGNALTPTDAGDVVIKARDIIMTGFNAIATFPEEGIYFDRSGINSSAATKTSGNGGSIQIETDRLSILDGAEIVSSNAASGNAGNILINARESITLDGNHAIDTSQAAYTYPYPRADDNFRSQISAGSEGGATGDSGLLTLNTPKLRVTNGAQISSSNLGTGNAGDINITASNLLSVNASAIAVNGSSSGTAGNLNIQAGRIELLDHARLQAEVMTGDRGNINLNANVLLMRRGSEISTNATGTAKGGNVDLNIPVMLGLENSNIIANAVQGRGGNINITTQSIIGLEFRNTLTPRFDPTNDISASSQSNVNGTIQISNIGTDPNSGLVQLPSTLTDANQKLAARCGANQSSRFVITGRGGIPTNPVQKLANRDRTWSDLRDLSQLQGEAIANSSQSGPLVEAISWHRNPQTGKVELIAGHSGYSTQPLTCN